MPQSTGTIKGTAGQSKAAPGADPDLGRRDEVILVVEDDVALLKLIEKRLAAAGHRTAGATDGAAALAWLRQQSPSLMLLDYSLPDMRGEQLLEQIEALGITRAVRGGHRVTAARAWPSR